jgi:signal recognition particle receptor subunit beta
LSGDDEFQHVRPSYLRGAAGYLLVVDGTRRSTIDTGLMLQTMAHDQIRNLPFVAVVNKADLVVAWDVEPRDLEELTRRAGTVLRTSAKTGSGVEEAFAALLDAIG